MFDETRFFQSIIFYIVPIFRGSNVIGRLTENFQARPFFLVISQQIEQIKDLELISSVDLSFCTPEKPNKPARDSRDFRSGQINRVLKKKEFIVRKTPGDI